jgi:hypothetical protein
LSVFPTTPLHNDAISTSLRPKSRQFHSSTEDPLHDLRRYRGSPRSRLQQERGLQPLDRTDVKAFMAYLLRAEKLDTSTAIDKAILVAKIMRDAGAPIAMIKGDCNDYTRPDAFKCKL